MSALVVVLGAVTAAAAGLRSTWSPCGLSMLSKITPMGEASRGRRYRATVAWFILGATLGGLTLGLVAAALAAAVSAVGLSSTTALMAVAALGLLAAAADSGVVGPTPPHHRRQVNETWLDQFRGWVYGMGFGWQIGAGVVTYIMTTAVYLTVAVAALTARPLTALALGGLFGLVRGLVVLAGRRLTTSAAMVRFHQRLEEAAPRSIRAMVGVEVAVATVAAAAAWWPAAVAVAVAGGALLLVTRADGVRRASARQPSVESPRAPRLPVS